MTLTETPPAETDSPEQPVQDLTAQELTGELAGRLFEAGLGAFELATVSLGNRLGLYRALADSGPCTAAQLAASAGIDPRYTREWCEQQAVAGLLSVDSAAESAVDGPDERRFSLPRGSAAVLLDPESPAYLIPLGGFLEAVGRVLPSVETAFRTGRGVPYADYEVQHVQSAFNRPAFTGQLVQEWLPQIPDLHATLGVGGTVAEFGCGEGWAAIALAVGYPHLQIDGFDIDPPSIETARRNAEAAGVADRVRFVVADVADPALTGSYDGVLAFEMLHDLPHPVEALRAARRLTGDGAAPVIIVDERVREEFTAPADPIERFFYAASVLHCLPVGRDAEHSAETGTVMRPNVLRRYATEAGFHQVTVLPIENDLFRFYRLQG
ncbi:MAG TPA: class I SAM-dependent methyltransferase [Nakamurella sp.]|nr:class I SAM-dependent methyltransferase [Nakamurella sp.]